MVRHGPFSRGNERGQALIEYAAIVAVVGACLVAILGLVGRATNRAYERTASAVSEGKPGFQGGGGGGGGGILTGTSSGGRPRPSASRLPIRRPAASRRPTRRAAPSRLKPMRPRTHRDDGNPPPPRPAHSRLLSIRVPHLTIEGTVRHDRPSSGPGQCVTISDPSSGKARRFSFNDCSPSPRRMTPRSGRCIAAESSSGPCCAPAK